MGVAVVLKYSVVLYTQLEVFHSDNTFSSQLWILEALLPIASWLLIILNTKGLCLWTVSHSLSSPRGLQGVSSPRFDSFTDAISQAALHHFQSSNSKSRSTKQETRKCYSFHQAFHYQSRSRFPSRFSQRNPSILLLHLRRHACLQLLLYGLGST